MAPLLRFCQLKQLAQRLWQRHRTASQSPDQQNLATNDTLSVRALISYDVTGGRRWLLRAVRDAHYGSACETVSLPAPSVIARERKSSRR